LPVELLPDVELPYLFVNIVPVRDTDPAHIESEALIPVESAIGTLENIDKIESYADSRGGMITVTYNRNTSVKYAYLKLQEKIAEIRPTLPSGYIILLNKIDIEQATNQFMSLEIRGEGGLDRVRYLVDSELKREFESLNGISSVSVSGGREKSVEIILQDEAVEAYGLTPSGISALIGQNSASNTYVGQVYGDGISYFVNVVAEYTDIAEIENIIVSKTGPVLLRDVAEIYFGVKEQTSISRVNGMETVTMDLVRDGQANLIELSHATRDVVSRLNREMKDTGVEVVVRDDNAELMEKNIDLIIRLAVIGGLLAVAILWIFLRNLRLVLIIALSIPISVFTAFNFFYSAGISINTLTLIGMALAVGMLVDNSVVVLENIYRLVSSGMDTTRAVIQGVTEVWRSIVAATLTTITVFVPFMFSSEFLVRTIGKHVGVSIISTLLVSLVVALFLVPMVTHFFLSRRSVADRAGFQGESGGNRMLQIYTVLLKACLRYPIRTIITTVVAFFASVILCFGMSLNVTEEAEADNFNIYVTMPSGSNLSSADLAVADLEQRLESIAEKEDVVSKIYEEEAVLTVTLKEDYDKIANRSMQAVKEDARKRMEGFTAAEVSFDPPASSRRYRGGHGGMARNMERMFGIGSQREKVVIKGNSIESMQDTGENIRYFLENLESVSSADMNINENSPEIHLLFDTKAMSYYDIPLASVASELASFSRESPSSITFKQGTDEYEIVIKKSDQSDRKMDDLRTLPIQGQSGSIVELQNLGDIVYSHGMPGINRVNQEKQIEVTYEFNSDVNSSKEVLETARAEVDQMVSNLVIPSGVAVEVVHEENDYSEFKFLTAVAFILIYMILASVFESFATPVVMMFTIPLAAIGSFWLLIFTGTSLLNAYTLTGFLILLGVVVNNGIILLDYSLILRRRGFRRPRALMLAGRARTRPILITSITTIVAMVPLAMGRTEQAAMLGAPFAITVIGGLTLSTLFTLIFIPVVYSGMESALQWLRGLDYRIRLGQLAAFIAGCWLIYVNVDSTIWRIIFLSAITFVIPGLTWFALSSLRTAKTEIIPEDEPIRITIRNLAKIYDQPSRFMREWNRGKRIPEGLLESDAPALRGDPGSLLWKLPLLGFMIYFVYFYLTSALWTFILVHPIFFFALHVLKSSRECLVSLHASRGDKKGSPIFGGFSLRAADILRQAILWGYPLFNIAFFWFRWRNIAAVIFAGLLWYSALLIFVTAEKLHREKVNIARITGRLATIKKGFYYLVRAIPVVGTKKEPFRALAGVSLEIEKGMFGLLGPNGAGKTTLMRIICGILDQSYGKIDINGIDINEKREELQGLIGYLPQEFGMYENMTAWEFLNYQGILKGLTDREAREKMVEYVLGAVHMDESRDTAIGSFSGGMKQRIGIAQILLHLPRILVVDEPTAGLDPRERIRFRNLLVELSRDRVVIFSTHIIEDIYSSCNKVAVLDRGRLLYLDDPAKMKDLARGRVWQFLVAPRDFEQTRETMKVVHHMRQGEMIRVRVISDGKPVEHADEVVPTLEDAYLWLLKDKDRT
ncbi:MAG: efflux RND transporter permease subunit, partial [Candidatus Krumholzibacteria bacterium]|nr:efflux RND transporter permease subunit [Candidatus Krumholzibacteria bacterium]